MNRWRGSRYRRLAFAGPSGAPTLHVDSSITATKYDALTDGLLVICYLFRFKRLALTAGALGLGGTATRAGSAAVKTYLGGTRAALVRSSFAYQVAG